MPPSYLFDYELAVKYGVDEAIMLQNFIFWIAKNKACGRNFEDDKYWTFASQDALQGLFGFWTRDQIRRVLNSLISQGVIITKKQDSYDRTTWYALKDEKLISYVPHQQVKHPLPRGKNPQSMRDKSPMDKGKIPDVNTYNNTDNNTYLSMAPFSQPQPEGWKDKTLKEIHGE